MNLGQQDILTPRTGRSILRGSFGVAVMLSLALGTASCGKIQRPGKKTEFAFDGIEFKTKVEKVDKEDRSHFKIEVRKATQSLNGAKEAGGYGATRYCIEQYGSSKIHWIAGPDQENDTLTLIDGDLWLEGICKI
ncbi:hypothetical protein SAMN05444000_11181 [Shimia gijangensis]|uniref:Uncharacterized protein n=1 Tax=Shimia gijangensis TaxID=1470563 RepID=A0A1M6L4S3_9RHOB|nr:hypothetical protein [Shimia gijangensis]SHJ66190.1 hypothetical protein SAMN05444000_11181 [Shimia gijangensis]